MARYLVVAHQTAGSPELHKHIETIVRYSPNAEFTVLVPATPVTHMFIWREEESLSVARRNMEHSAALLREAGANVTRSVIGSRFPVDAIADELRDSPGYDEIIICTFPPGVSRWLKLDLIGQAEKRTGLPVTHVVARPARVAAPQPVAPAGEPLLEDSERSRESSTPSSSTATAEPLVEPAGEASRAPTLEGDVSEEELGSLQLPHLEREDIPEDARELWDRLDEGRGVANIFRTMGHNRTLLHSYVEMLNALWNESGVDDQTRELVILRTAMVQRSTYVWHHHVRIARELAIPDEAITALEHWRSSEHVKFDGRQRAVLGFVDALTQDKRPPVRMYQQLTDYYAPQAIVGLALLVGFYRMTGSFTEALQVELEERFVGWQLY